MQSVYALWSSKSENLPKEETFLNQSIDNIYELYIQLLDLIVAVQDQAKNKQNLAQKKILATDEDLNPSLNFVNNQVIQKLKTSVSLQERLGAQKQSRWTFNFEYPQLLFAELSEQDFYKEYLIKDKPVFADDQLFILELFEKVIAPNEKLHLFLEDLEISWTDDLPFVNSWIMRSIEFMKMKNPFVLNALYKDEEDSRFVLELFRKTVLNNEKLEGFIENKTPNWEKERIAHLDMILLKMALCEILNFPSIPVKATINEYIEIAKEYSTEKSHYFINGVLDKLCKELDEKTLFKK